MSIHWLITGSSGWLGKNLVGYLRNQYPQSVISGFDLLPSEREVDHFIQGDLRDTKAIASFFESIRRPTAYLLHLAGVIHPHRTKEFYDINLLGTQNLLTRAARAGISRAVVLSSNSPFGFNPSQKGARRPNAAFTEESPFHPYMNYGKSKMLMEKWVCEHRQTIGPQVMETTIIRAPWFYGPFQPERQTLFFKMIREGKFPIVGNGENLRSMAFTKNLAQGLTLAATHPKGANENFWIADDRAYSMNEIVSTVRDLLREDFGLTVNPRTVHLPSIASPIAEIIDRFVQSTGLYHQKFHVLSEMGRNIYCSIAKAKQLLGYQPQYDLKEGMRESMDWCIKQGIPL